MSMGRRGGGLGHVNMVKMEGLNYCRRQADISLTMRWVDLGRESFNNQDVGDPLYCSRGCSEDGVVIKFLLKILKIILSSWKIGLQH